MKLIITRIEEHIVTCEFKDGTLLDIDRKWLDKHIKVGDTIEVEIQHPVSDARIIMYNEMNNIEK